MAPPSSRSFEAAELPSLDALTEDQKRQAGWGEDDTAITYAGWEGTVKTQELRRRADRNLQAYPCHRYKIQARGKRKGPSLWFDVVADPKDDVRIRRPPPSDWQ